MKRDSLHVLFRNLVMASLPWVGCSGEPTAGTPDLSQAPFPPGCGASTTVLVGVGRHFACMAQLEAASVEAFEILEAELLAHRAPAHLSRAAARAARDEVRHKKMTGALARRHQAPDLPLPPRGIKPREVRPLLAIAIENAVEGCVRETFGALVATWQERTAGDRRIREARRSSPACARRSGPEPTRRGLIQTLVRSCRSRRPYSSGTAHEGPRACSQGGSRSPG